MRKVTAYVLSIAAFFAAAGAHAEDAQSILAKARELQLERWDGVKNYVVDQTIAGMNVSTLYERVGETSFRVVPRSQLQSTFAEGDDDGMLADFDDIQELASTASLVGTESIEGRNAWHLKADDVDHVQQVEDREIAFDTFEIWVDQGDYVPLKIRIHGKAIANGQARPIVIEKVDSDYRNVPGSNLYEAYRQVMTMNGVLSPEEKKQVEEARKQMAEMEKQLASLPDAQRQMMEQMMGPQMDMVKKMAAGEGIEVVTEVRSIKVNVGK